MVASTRPIHQLAFKVQLAMSARFPMYHPIYRRAFLQMQFQGQKAIGANTAIPLAGRTPSSLPNSVPSHSISDNGSHNMNNPIYFRKCLPVYFPLACGLTQGEAWKQNQCLRIRSHTRCPSGHQFHPSDSQVSARLTSRCLTYLCEDCSGNLHIGPSERR